MIAFRWGSLRPPQAAISFNVRPQPTHKLVWPLTMQTFKHGVETGTAFIGAT